MVTNFGRKILYTDVPVVTMENISEILRNVMPEHEMNARDISFLMEYDAGKQEKFRIKTYRADIDNWCIDNVANEVSSFWIGYGWGHPITLSMRKRNDESTNDITNGIFELNKFYDVAGNKSKNQELPNQTPVKII